MIEWHRRVADARSVEALLDVVVHYLRSIHYGEWATVPETCRPVGIQGVQGLRFWHDRLVDEFCRLAADMRHSRTHQDLVAFFTAALERAEELAPSSAANDAQASLGQRNPTKP